MFEFIYLLFKYFQSVYPGSLFCRYSRLCRVLIVFYLLCRQCRVGYFYFLPVIVLGKILFALTKCLYMRTYTFYIT